MELSRKQVLDLVKGNEWNTQVFNAYPLYLMCAATESGWLVSKKFGAGYTHFFYLFSNGRAYMYYDRRDWERICDGYYAQITSRAELKKLIVDHQLSYQKLVAKTIYDEDKLDSLSTSELITLLQILCARLIGAVGAAHGIEGITYGSEKKLRTLLNKASFSEEEFGIICAPIHPSFLSEAQNKLREIKFLKKDAKDAAINKFIQDFGWIENTYLGRKKFSYTDVIHRINGLQDSQISFDAEQVRKKKAELLSRFKLTVEESFIITTVELCFHWQDERKKYILQSIEVLEPVVEEISRRLNVDMVTLKFINPSEISEPNLTNTEFHSELKKRREKSVCYSVPEQNYIFTNSDFDFFAQNLHIILGNDSKEIKGTVASPGVIRGIARICESVSDIDKVQGGEVLVASMTRPEYLPAMQRAIAFVTDEGGITCHAAIVAREMKKPCIIGTKIATKVLKDGDLVEVDAHKGIVKILKQ